MGTYRNLPPERFANLAGRVLSGEDFSDYDLLEADFSGSICRGCDFTGAMLAWSNLRRADMESADIL